MRWRVLKAITKTVMLEHVRTPEAVFWTYGFPLVMALVLGFAFGEGRLEPVRVAVVSTAAEVDATTLADALREHANGRIDVVRLDADRAHRALTLGSIDMVVSGSPGEPVFELDPRRSGSELARLHALQALRAARGEISGLRETIDEVDEPGDRYIDFLIAGLIGMNLLGAGMYGIGYNIVTMRAGKLLRRLSVTPMRRSEFLAAFLVSRTALSLPPPVAILAFGMIVFGVPVRGSWLVLLGLFVLGALTFAGLGLLVASRARTTESVSGWINIVTMPMWLLGGIFFSNERFPDVMQPLIRVIPMTSFTDGVRGVMLGSQDGGEIALAAAVLAVIGLASYGLAIRLFRWS